MRDVLLGGPTDLGSAPHELDPVTAPSPRAVGTLPPLPRRRDLRLAAARPAGVVTTDPDHSAFFAVTAGEAPRTVLLEGPQSPVDDVVETIDLGGGETVHEAGRAERRRAEAVARRRRRRLAVGAGTATAVAALVGAIALDGSPGGSITAAAVPAATDTATGAASTTSSQTVAGTSTSPRRTISRKSRRHRPAATATTTASRSASASTTTTSSAPKTSSAPSTSQSAPASASGNASSGNTGVPAGKTLKVHQGDLTITTPGTHIDGLDVRGFVLIKADDVLITNTRIRGRAGANGKGLVHAVYGKTGIVIEDSTIIPDDPNVDSNGVKGGGFTLRRVEIAKNVDSVEVFGNNVRIEDSWLHDHIHYASDPVQGGGPSHNDGVQVLSGKNITITGNTITGAANAAIQVTQDDGAVSGLNISGNVLDNGTCSVKLHDKGVSTALGPVTVTNNRFGGNQTISGCGVLRTSRTLLSASGNIWSSSGNAVAVKVDG